MTFAPATIREVRTYFRGEDSDLSDIELGITGGPSHVAEGTSYHLGADQLKMNKNPYSVRTARDRNGLSNAASALDVDDDLDELRELSVWVVGECRGGASDCGDIREIIYSPNGRDVLQWDRERGVTSAPRPHSDLSHRFHTHFSWYRDSEFRSKVSVFKRFFGDSVTTPTEEHIDYMAWRVEALAHMRPVIDSDRAPNKGEQLEVVSVLQFIATKVGALASPVIDPIVLRAAVRDALLDPAVAAAIAKAVNDDNAERMKSR